MDMTGDHAEAEERVATVVYVEPCSPNAPATLSIDQAEHRGGDAVLLHQEETDAAVRYPFNHATHDVEAASSAAGGHVVDALVSGIDLCLLCCGSSPTPQQQHSPPLLGTATQPGVARWVGRALFERLQRLTEQSAADGLRRIYDVHMSYAIMHADAPRDLLNVERAQLHVELAQAQGQLAAHGTCGSPNSSAPPAVEPSNHAGAVRLKRGGGKGVHIAGLHELLVSNAQQWASMHKEGGVAPRPPWHGRAAPLITRIAWPRMAHAALPVTAPPSFLTRRLEEALRLGEENRERSGLSGHAVLELRLTQQLEATTRDFLAGTSATLRPLDRASSVEQLASGRKLRARARLVVLDEGGGGTADVLGDGGEARGDRGLTALRAVVHALSRPASGPTPPPPPYAASSLTMLLQARARSTAVPHHHPTPARRESSPPSHGTTSPSVFPPTARTGGPRRLERVRAAGQRVPGSWRALARESDAPVRHALPQDRQPASSQ